VGLSWHQGPLSPGAIGRFLVPEPLPKRLLYAEPLRRRIRVRFGGKWIADSEHASCSSNPAVIRWPASRRPTSFQTPYSASSTPPGTPTSGSRAGTRSGRTRRARREGRGSTSSYPPTRASYKGGSRSPGRAMDAFYEEDERIMGHAADSYHRIDIRQASRHLVVRHGDRIIADTKRPVVLYESGFAPRWYVTRADIDESALTPVEHRTFCPYNGLCSCYDIGDARLAA
jgi:uncharacterized protein (DUF427 family)